MEGYQLTGSRREGPSRFAALNVRGVDGRSEGWDRISSFLLVRDSLNKDWLINFKCLVGWESLEFQETS